MAPHAKRAKVGAKPKASPHSEVNASLSKPRVSGQTKLLSRVDEAASSEDEASSDEEASFSELDEEEMVSHSDTADESDEESDLSDSDAAEDKPDAKPFSDHFDTALNSILGSKIKAHDASNPVLIRNKRTAKEIDEAREDRKVRRALRAEKQQFKDKARIKQVIPKDPELAGEAISREKTLRKTAQRGVVKLLNAINSAQTAALASTSEESSTDRRKAEASTEVSKEKFLDMIRMG